jgi:tetratricopeptide (TPR) repeat protein
MVEKRFKIILSLLIALTTFLGSMLVFLREDVTVQRSMLARDSRVLAIQSITLGAQAYSHWNLESDLLSKYQELSQLETLESVLPADANTVNQLLLDLASKRIILLKESLRPLAQSLQAPYFNPQLGISDMVQLLVDQNFVPATELNELQEVKKDESVYRGGQADSFLLGITILAVSLFFYGLSLTISGKLRLFFTATGVCLTLAVVCFTFYAMSISFQAPSREAIRLYSKAYGQAQKAQLYELLSYHTLVGKPVDEAIAYYNEALADSPQYDALYQGRGVAHLTKAQSILFGSDQSAPGKGELEQAIADLQETIRLGRDDFTSFWSLGWALYLSGDYQSSLQALQTSSEKVPEQRFGIGLQISLNQLASGQIDQAKTTLENAIAWAADPVHALSSDPWFYKSMIRNLYELKIAQPVEGMDWMEKRLKEAFVCLVSFQQTNPRPIEGTMSPLIFFTDPIYDDSGKLIDYTVREEFPAGTVEIYLQFEYGNMKDTYLVSQKVYRDGQEQSLYGKSEPWSIGESGSGYWGVTYPIRGVVNRYLAPGKYVIDIFVEGNLLTSGQFTVD